MESEKRGTHKMHESYLMLPKHLAKYGVDAAAAGFANLMPWGTPDMVLEKLSTIRDMIDANGFMLNFSYGGMPYDEVERNLKCCVKHVLPEVMKRQTEPLPERAEMTE